MGYAEAKCGEQPIETVMAMYEFSNSTVRVNIAVGSKFIFKVGVHQESVLNPLLVVQGRKNQVHAVVHLKQDREE